MKRNRRIAAALLLGLASAFAAAAPPGGSVTIDSCLEKARARYPLARQYSTIAATRRLDLGIARRGYLPRLSLSGKTSYQSDVTSLSDVAASLPPQMASALDGIGADKGQYQALAEVSQTIWDGGAIAAQVKGIEASSRVEERRLDVDVYALNDRVEQLFFGVLALREQRRQNAILLGQLDSSLRRVEASLRNGVASPYDLNAVRVEILNAKQGAEELSANEAAEREMLSELVGEKLPDAEAFAMPGGLDEPEGDDPSGRPEMALFSAQDRQLDSQGAAVRAANMPKLSAFFQTAYGEPGLNLFSSGASGYWIGGLRLSWSLNGLLDWKAQLDRIDEARAAVASRRDAFVLDTVVKVGRIRKDIERLRSLLEGDDEIIRLRESMRKSMEGKEENGSATTDDVLKAIDAEDLARRTRSLHEVQLSSSIYALKNALSR